MLSPSAHVAWWRSARPRCGRCPQRGHGSDTAWAVAPAHSLKALSQRRELQAPWADGRALPAGMAGALSDRMIANYAPSQAQDLGHLLAHAPGRSYAASRAACHPVVRELFVHLDQLIAAVA